MTAPSEPTPPASGRMSTHTLGVLCGVCKAVLVPDDCCPGQPHGSTYQQPSEWIWPNHPCTGGSR